MCICKRKIKHFDLFCLPWFSERELDVPVVWRAGIGPLSGAGVPVRLPLLQTVPKQVLHLGLPWFVQTFRRIPTNISMLCNLHIESFKSNIFQMLLFKKKKKEIQCKYEFDQTFTLFSISQICQNLETYPKHFHLILCLFSM